MILFWDTVGVPQNRTFFHQNLGRSSWNHHTVKAKKIKNSKILLYLQLLIFTVCSLPGSSNSHFASCVSEYKIVQSHSCLSKFSSVSAPRNKFMRACNITQTKHSRNQTSPNQFTQHFSTLHRMLPQNGIIFQQCFQNLILCNATYSVGPFLSFSTSQDLRYFIYWISVFITYTLSHTYISFSLFLTHTQLQSPWSNQFLIQNHKIIELSCVLQHISLTWRYKLFCLFLFPA